MEYLKRELSQPFSGWDFSHLNGRWSQEDLSWDYKKIVLEHLNDEMLLLDMGTGGGEFLLELDHPYEKTVVTESYPPNIKLCREKLSPLGIAVFGIDSEEKLPFPDAHFDMIINRHESYELREVMRILKPNGFFITQQVGKDNNRDMSFFLNEKYQSPYPDMYLEKQVSLFRDIGFRIDFAREEFPILKFFDIGAFAYFANIITWEFPDFNVEKLIDKLYFLHQRILNDGYIISTEHRFIIIAKKQE